MKLTLGILTTILLGFVATTWWALESGGVALVETRAADGSPRSTHVWYAEIDGARWLEAGTPRNPWFVDVQAEPLVRLTTDGQTLRYRARPMPGRPARERIRAALRTKYGFRDVWVGLLVDTSESVAVRLEPLAAD